ncbi:MAG TPA: xanthine dehydrogenase family protein subunit M [Candidatus Binataceae bacterium]|nr:xanthine dehydrogenase family protein subunit M [Candidatus Binataceae bacterium]
MNRFALIAPSSLAQAAKLLAERGNVAIAGGVDMIDLLKQGLLEPRALVNLKGFGMDRIEADNAGGMRIGALVKLHDLANHPEMRTRYTAIADAAGEAATPQIRNLATAGGNLLQRPRCWYFRNPDVDCLKKGGLKCYAADGLNRYHAILGGGPSYIVHPSNLAPALIAYGASVQIHSAQGDRTVELEKFFVLPKTDVLRENLLQPGEIITAIIVPGPPSGAHGVYIEAREKQSFDWPLVSVAAVVERSAGNRVRSARIVMGAVAPIPWRVPDAEAALVGAVLDSASASRAAEVALRGAAPLHDNAYKVPIAKALVRRAILRAGGISEDA